MFVLVFQLALLELVAHWKGNNACFIIIVSFAEKGVILTEAKIWLWKWKLLSSLHKSKLKIRVSCGSSIWFELENVVFSLSLSLSLLKQWTSSSDFVSRSYPHPIFITPCLRFTSSKSHAPPSFINQWQTCICYCAFFSLSVDFCITRILGKVYLLFKNYFSQGLFPRRSNVHSILRGCNRQTRGDNIRRALPQTPLLGGG